MRVLQKNIIILHLLVDSTMSVCYCKITKKIVFRFPDKIFFRIFAVGMYSL